MSKYWVRQIDGSTIDLNQTINAQERQFAHGDSGTADSRYALELAIEFLSREAEHPHFAASHETGGAMQPEGPSLIAA